MFRQADDVLGIARAETTTRSSSTAKDAPDGALAHVERADAAYRRLGRRGQVDIIAVLSPCVGPRPCEGDRAVRGQPRAATRTTRGPQRISPRLPRSPPRAERRHGCGPEKPRPRPGRISRTSERTSGSARPQPRCSGTIGGDLRRLGRVRARCSSKAWATRAIGPSTATGTATSSPGSERRRSSAAIPRPRPRSPRRPAASLTADRRGDAHLVASSGLTRAVRDWSGSEVGAARA